MAESIEVKAGEGGAAAGSPGDAGPLAVRRSGWDMLSELQSEMEELWSRYWPGGSGRRRMPSFAPLASRLGGGSAWSMATDVYRKDGRLWVKADLPGMNKADISVSLDNGDLVVSGKREEEHKAEEGGWVRSERTFGSFYRRVPLPVAVKPEDVRARFDNGVLEVSVPLPPEAAGEAPTKIEVQ